MLTDVEIRQHGLIEDLPEETRRLKAASYDLRVGNEIGRNGEVKKLNAAAAIRFEPFETMILSTAERVHVPARVVGSWGLRMTLSLRGFILQAGPQIEPGYHGPLFALILNSSSKEQEIRVGESLATVWFQYTVSESDKVEAIHIASLAEYVEHKDLQWAWLAPDGIFDDLLRATDDLRTRVQALEKVRREEVTDLGNNRRDWTRTWVQVGAAVVLLAVSLSFTVWWSGRSETRAQPPLSTGSPPAAADDSSRVSPASSSPAEDRSEPGDSARE